LAAPMKARIWYHFRDPGRDARKQERPMPTRGELTVRTVLLFGIAAATLTGGAAAQSDEFNAGTLNPSWFWIREDVSHWSLKTRPGYLRIVTQKGDIAGTSYRDARNLLVQGTRSGDFVLETRLRIQPTHDYHQAGFLAYQNDDNYVKFVRGHVLREGGQLLELISEKDGKITAVRLRVNHVEIHLRLTKTGNSFKGEYSVSGKPLEWFLVGSVSASLDAPKIGLMAISGPLTLVPEIPADFDYFRASGSAIVQVQPTLVGTPRPGATVFVDLAAEAGGFYHLGAALGTGVGIPIGSRKVPLNVDPLLMLTVSGQLSGIFRHFTGYLNARGEARAWIDFPADNGLVGVVFYLAFVTLDSGQPFGIGTISLATKVQVAS
jgi:regulation of enolase protein 1 (concanavalin A-like superfamily)